MPRTISLFAISALFLVHAGLSLITLFQLHELVAKSSNLSQLEKELQALEQDYQYQRIEASKIGNGFLSQEVAKLNFEKVQSFNFVSAQETVAQK